MRLWTGVCEITILFSLCGFASGRGAEKIKLVVHGEKRIVVEALSADSKAPLDALPIDVEGEVRLVDDRGSAILINKTTTLEQLQQALKDARTVFQEAPGPELQQFLEEEINPAYLKHREKAGLKTVVKKKGKYKEAWVSFVITIDGGLTFLIRGE